APTLRFWIRGRTQTNGPADYANVHKVQDGYKLTPLGAFGKTYAPPQSVPTDPTVDGKTPPMVQVNRVDGVTILMRLRALLGTYGTASKRRAISALGGRGATLREGAV